MRIFNFSPRVKTGKILFSGTAAFLIGITIGAVLWSLGGVPFQIGPATPGQTDYLLVSPLERFSSYEELRSFVGTSSQVRPYWGYFESTQTPKFVVQTLGGAEESVPEYSTTNIQVAGVDEADVVKTDGEYIYVISGQRIIILKAYPADEAKVLSQIELNGTLMGIFINGDKLAVFQSAFSPYYGTLAPYAPAPYEAFGTFIKVYDVSNRENPVLKRTAALEGEYFSSRMIGDYVYAVINRPAYWLEREVPLPKTCYDGRVEEIPASDIYYSNVSDSYYTFTTIVAVNMHDDAQEPAQKTFLLGSTSGMYVSLGNIYITLPGQWDAVNGVEKTPIYRIHIEEGEIDCAAGGGVPGYLLNQFSMDEQGDYFRVATTTGHIARTLEQATSKNHLYVLDMDLAIVGRLEDLAPGEKIYSARFMGDRCYLVTFKKVDPLFVIDLTDPLNPAVLGWLKVTGYSDYLHPYDEDHVIGIGKETVAAEEGDFSWYQGVKISLFDVSDVSEPREIDKYVIGDRGTDSPVLTDHKALLFDRTRGLLVIPVLLAEIDRDRYPSGAPPSTYGEYVWQGAYVFHISLDGLVLRGNVTHLRDAADLMNSAYHVKRALYIDDVLYTVSDRKIKMNSLEDLGEVNAVELP